CARMWYWPIPDVW
nr:immunoglobulin heavy chain junction region [Macaca mulatta]